MNIFSIKNKNILSVVMSSSMLLAVLLLPTSLHAHWDSNASAEANTFQTASLATTVSDVDLNASLSRSSGDTVQFTIADSGTLTGIETIHKLKTTPDTCAASFYQGIDVILDIDDDTVYNNTLAALDATSTDSGTIALELVVNQNLQTAENETCEVTITLDSFQTHFSDNTYGFSDTHTISLTITASEAIGPQSTTNVVLNEIYPSVLSTTTVPYEREWVELYNGTGADINVEGYAISEISGSDEVLYEIAATCPSINTNHYVTPLNSSNTNITSGGYLVLEFCGGSSYLNDSGDTVSLYDGNSTTTATQLDTHTYPTTTNGKSHQRIPDGGTWVDPLPTPGMPNSATREDLEAEGWSDEEIKKVLSTLQDSNKENDAPPNSNKGTSQPDDPIRNEEDGDICVEVCKKDEKNEKDIAEDDESETESVGENDADEQLYNEDNEVKNSNDVDDQGDKEEDNPEDKKNNAEFKIVEGQEVDDSTGNEEQNNEDDKETDEDDKVEKNSEEPLKNTIEEDKVSDEKADDTDVSIIEVKEGTGETDKTEETNNDIN